MIKITNDQIASLMRMLVLTKSEEANCDECLTKMAEFAEVVLAGKSVPAGLQAIDDHLKICVECCDEFEALKLALESE